MILCSAAPGVPSEKDQDIHRTCSSNFFGSLYQFSASIFNPYYIFIFLVTVTTAFPSLSITDSNSVDTPDVFASLVYNNEFKSIKKN